MEFRIGDDISDFTLSLQNLSKTLTVSDDGVFDKLLPGIANFLKTEIISSGLEGKPLSEIMGRLKFIYEQPLQAYRNPSSTPPYTFAENYQQVQF